MDTRTASASPAPDVPLNHEVRSPLVQDKISAYYSLVFPHFTFYIQTLEVTIGRRCVPSPNAATSSTAEPPQVDVDLGALKSVSRLHAKIEYDQAEDRFVLVVIGRNGAWVDGVWSASGTRAPLGERSQIQIASRTFNFVLPPPPPPEDTPSPSSQSSTNRQRSPSLDITSISPPSSQPSHSPPLIAKAKLPPLPIEPEPPQLPNSNAIGKAKAKASNPKKRKKTEAEPVPIPPRPKPEDMPPKPPFTYAQLIYRAINAIDGKATLQEICNWIMTTHEYYRYADNAWMSSVRHNLSSGRAFMKMERCGGDRGKGFFWSLDEKYRQTFEDQEAKFQQAAAGGQGKGGKDGMTKGGRKKDKGAPLGPPLTLAPLTAKPLATTTKVAAPVSTSNPTSSTTTGVFPYQVYSQHVPMVGLPNVSGYNGAPITAPNPYAALTKQPWASGGTSTTNPTTTDNTQQLTTQPATQPQGAQNAVPDVSIPIILGPIPPTHPDYSPSHPNNSAKEGYMVLHERTLILDPSVFVGLTKEILEELERMGARAALAVLTGHMVRALKEKRVRERGGRRGRGTGKGRRGGAAGGGAGGSVTAAGGEQSVLGSPFTRAPLAQRKTELQTPAVPSLSPNDTGTVDGNSTAATATPAALAQAAPADAGSPLVVVDDDSDDLRPVSKRRKVDVQGAGDAAEDEVVIVI